MTAPSPQHDAPAPGIPGLGEGDLFVLVQVLPHVEVLATSFDRNRLLAEAMTMGQQVREYGSCTLFRWFVRRAAFHLA